MKEEVDLSNYDILRNELQAGEASFLIQLRVDLEWNKQAFTRLTTELERWCRQNRDVTTLDRGMADGVFYLQTFVRDWTSHTDFPRVHAAEYYETAYQRIDILAHWFFSGGPFDIEVISLDPM